jgi:hypothetical protein
MVRDVGDFKDESEIVFALAHEAAQRVARKTISHLQSINAELSGEDSGLKTVWDEICTQVQLEHSIFWEAYEETMRAALRGFVAKLPRLERAAIWMQSDGACDWSCSDRAGNEAYPVVDEDIVEYILREHVIPTAGSWSNASIRGYIER